MRCPIFVGLMACILVTACGDGGGNGEEIDVLLFLGLGEGKSWSYEVGAGLDGEMLVTGIDTDFRDGVSAYRLDLRVGGFSQATRWYQVQDAGLYLLGEETLQGTSIVRNTYLNSILVIPVPLVNAAGQARQTWTTESDLKEGGSETLRFDNLGKGSLQVAAGEFEAYHLVQTRTDRDGANHLYNWYFAPTRWFPQFDYPEETAWKLR